MNIHVQFFRIEFLQSKNLKILNRYFLIKVFSSVGSNTQLVLEGRPNCQRSNGLKLLMSFHQQNLKLPNDLMNVENVYGLGRTEHEDKILFSDWCNRSVKELKLKKVDVKSNDGEIRVNDGDVHVIYTTDENWAVSNMKKLSKHHSQILIVSETEMYSLI